MCIRDRLRLDDIGIKCFSQSCFFVLSGCFCVKRGRENGVFVYRPPNTIIASLRKKITTKLVPKLFFCKQYRMKAKLHYMTQRMRHPVQALKLSSVREMIRRGNDFEPRGHRKNRGKLKK